ncbi:hypothetical protein TURU_015369 [Turdus rufiventris]|nr:hypothetical protein TURU_015369 [Turdus rufiventris]
MWKRSLKVLLQELQQNSHDAKDSDGNDITYEHLCGEGDWHSPQKQTRALSKSVLDKICNVAEKAFNQLPTVEVKDGYVNIKQFASKNFLQFVDHLHVQVERQVQDPVVQAELIKEVWQPCGCFRIVTTKGSTVPRSTDRAITAVDLLKNLLDVTIQYMEVDTAHTSLEIEVAPMTIRGDMSHLILLACCPQPPFYLVEGQILAQAIQIPVEVPVDRKSPQVYWAEVVGQDKPSLACNLTRGSDHLHVKGVLDTVADVMIIPERMWLSRWDLQPMAGKIRGVGGIKLTKI